MFDENSLENRVGQVYKCGGIPFYPIKHSLYDKYLEGVSDEYIESRREHVRKFLNKYDLDLPVDED